MQDPIGRAMPEWKDVHPCPSPIESPINYFGRFFDMNSFSFICEQSSLYSAQRNPNKVASMTVNDLEQFMGIVLTYVYYETASNTHVLAREIPY